MSFNTITIVGNLGRDPELRYTPNGTPVCQFSMATNEKFKKQGEDAQTTTWFRVTVFGRQAESVSEYLTKGRQCAVVGRLRLEEWTDRDNKNRATLEVTADHVKFLGAAPDNHHQESMDNDAKKSRGREPSSEPPVSDDDIPF